MFVSIRGQMNVKYSGNLKRKLLLSLNEHLQRRFSVLEVNYSRYDRSESMEGGGGGDGGRGCWGPLNEEQELNLPNRRR